MKGFTFRYAIRMPDGQLYPPPPEPAPEPVPDYSVPSPMRDVGEQLSQMITGITGMFGIPQTQQDSPPPQHKPEIFDTLEEAEKKLAEIRAAAAKVGVINWGGTIVRQLCTPFTAGDIGKEFANQVAEWLRANGVQP
ncbi:hypothetical protein MSP7336_01834 [Mycobacterium shimoidei]|uniref:Uncharacterized protein n=1 Tax=Mycobacterium shimoidei TaxID=29313 RepID=A0A375YXW9_MYCSH|nr:hypothetical protein [Mycobacterium shimoidei]SRX93595.1 hypothetical protein MSP7336_01834 [Mycobacterium shimoidei]